MKIFQAWQKTVDFCLLKAADLFLTSWTNEMKERRLEVGMPYCPQFKRGVGTAITELDHATTTVTVLLITSNYFAVYAGFMGSIGGLALFFRVRQNEAPRVINRCIKFQAI